MSVNRSLIAATLNPQLDQALRRKLTARARVAGGLGELEALAIRLGLIQNTLTPVFDRPQLAIFASDHGLAVDGITAAGQASTAQLVQQLLHSQLPVSAFARIQGLEMSVVDCGIAESVPPHAQLLARKIAHGSRNTRVSAAMSLEQTHAAIRAGMEIADSMAGNMLACAGVGVGSHQSAALLLSRLSGIQIGDLLESAADGPEGEAQHIVSVLQAAQARHKALTDPVEVLAAFGGFDMAMMVGVMLVAGSKRHLILVDGIPACAALVVATRIAPAVTDYCLFTRSHRHRGLDPVLALFDTSALLELGMDCIDGTGATLAWPLVRSAAALLSDVADLGEPATPAAGGGTRPAPLGSVSRPSALG